MSWLNERMGKLKPSATLAVKAKATELKRAGVEIIDLSTGEPDVDTPEHIKEAARAALKAGKTKYTAAPGLVELREAVAHKLSEENGLTTSADSVIITNGGKQALHEVFEVTLSEGDEVIIPAPFWVSYPSMVELAGGTPAVVNTSPANGYRLTPEELAAAITDRTKALIINSPSNPTGAAYSADQLRELLEVVKGKDILVVSDEVYEKITFGDFQFSSVGAAAPWITDQLVTVNALSKTYSMTGWRVGYATGPAEIIKAMGKFQSQTTSNVNTPAQYAAIAALQGPQEFLVELVANFDRRINSALSQIESIDGLGLATRPEGAFYLFIRIDDLLASSLNSLTGSVDTATFLLEQAGVALVPGAAFGDDGAVRMSVAASDEDVAAGISKISAALDSL